MTSSWVTRCLSSTTTRVSRAERVEASCLRPNHLQITPDSVRRQVGNRWEHNSTLITRPERSETSISRMKIGGAARGSTSSPRPERSRRADLNRGWRFCRAIQTPTGRRRNSRNYRIPSKINHVDVGWCWLKCGAICSSQGQFRDSVCAPLSDANRSKNW